MPAANFPSRPVIGSRDTVCMPSRMVGRVLDILRHKFSNPDNIIRGELKDLLYTAEHDTSMLVIVPGFEAAPGSDIANVMPRVTVDVGNFQKVHTLSPGMDDDALTYGGGSESGWLGRVSHQATFNGVLTINAVSVSGMEALVIAEDILLTLLMLKAEIRDSLQLEHLDVNLLKGPLKHEGPPSCLIAGVQVVWAASIMWDTVPDGLPLVESSHPATI